MMNEEQREKYLKILEFYGLDSQIDMLTEECAELIQAINKYKRASNDIKKGIATARITYEIADVIIMLYQVIEGLKIPYSEIEEIVNYKLKRQLERMKGDTK